MSRGKQGRNDELALVGWQGVTLKAPAGWEPDALSGSREEGYLRLVDSEMPRLELKWATGPGLGRPLAEVLDSYLATIEKQAKKEHRELKVRRNTRLLSRRRLRKAALECYGWKAEQQALGAAWSCEQCGRTVIAQVLGAPDEDLEPLARQVLESVEDHPRDEWVLWSAFGLHFELPEDFLVQDQRLMAGLDGQRGTANIEVKFARGLEEVRVLRWSMADVLLRRISLMEWAQVKFARHLGWRGRCQAEEGEVKGHPAVLVRGRHERFHQRVQRFIMHCRRRDYPDRVACEIWRCEDTNKIYAVERELDALNSAVDAGIVARLKCH